MTAKATFKLADAKRLAKAAVAAGLSPDEMEFEARPDGTIIIRPLPKSDAGRSSDNPWDEVLDQ